MEREKPQLSFVSFVVDLRKLYYQTGVENKPTVFIFTDTQVLEESFLEDVNNILSSGEVPNLYKTEDFEEVEFHKKSLFYCFCFLFVLYGFLARKILVWTIHHPHPRHSTLTYLCSSGSMDIFTMNIK